MSNTASQSKIKIIIEIVVCYFLMQLYGFIFNGLGNLLNTDSLWIGVLSYACIVTSILFYTSRVEKRPLRDIGLCRVTICEILIGVLLGIVMFVAQQIPFLIMGVDYAMFASPPDWQHIIVMSIYCIVCVGVAEEVMLRGFILHKSMSVFNNKAMAILLNCIIFYLIHWPPIRFVFGEFFNVTLNTLILCVYYFFASKKKSIVPLIIAHGVYDITTVYLLPVAAYYFFS